MTGSPASRRQRLHPVSTSRRSVPPTQGRREANPAGDETIVGGRGSRPEPEHGPDGLGFFIALCVMAAIGLVAVVLSWLRVS